MTSMLTLLILLLMPALGGCLGAMIALKWRGRTEGEEYTIHVALDTTDAELGVKRLEQRLKFLAKNMENVSKQASAIKMAVVVGAMLAVAGCSGCNHNPSPRPTQPTNVTDAGWDGSTPATCLDLCRHGQALGCSWAEPTPAGATCLIVCLAAQSAPGVPSWDLDCRTRAVTCAAVDRCN